MISLGLDPSLSGTGIVVLSQQGNEPVEVLEEERLPAADGKHFIGRCQPIVARVLTLARTYLPPAAPLGAVVIEDYAYGNKFSLVKLAELQTFIRLRLYEIGVGYKPVAPNALKKFATGKGGAGKPEIKRALLKEFRYRAPNHDVGDAYVLARIGLALQGMPCRTTEQVQVLAELRKTV